MCGGKDTIFGYQDLRRNGTSRREIDLALARGQLTRVRKGVYVTQSTCEDVETAAAHGGVIACATALRHAGCAVWRAEGVHVWLGRAGRRREHEGCECIEHWSHGLPAERHEPAPLVLALWQLFECAGSEAFFVSLESALHQDLLDPQGLRWLARTLPTSGRSLCGFAHAKSESILESLFRVRMRWLGWRVVAQAVVSGVGRVDFLIDGWLIVELDGRLGHALEADRHKDLTRDAKAAALGYSTLRFTSRMVFQNWEFVEETVTAKLFAGPRRRLRR